MMFDYCAFDICSLGLLSSKKKKRCKQEICLKKDKRLRLNDGCFEFFFFFFLENKDKSQQTHHTTLKQGRFNVDSSLDVESTLFQRCVFAELRL